jgi:PAS domain S-box-containing protein
MGGVGILAPSPLALSLFLAPIAAAMIVRLVVQGGPIFIGIGVIGVFYVALLARTGREFYRALADSIGTRFVNQALIDRLRQSQDALSDAIESLPEAIAIYDADDRLVLCNRKYAQAQTTFDDPAQLVGKSFAELVRLSVAKGEAIEAEFAGNIDAWIAERIRRREEEAGREPRMYRIGDGRWMLTGISRTRGGGIVAVRTDITRLREAEISLKAALDEQELIFEAVTTGIAFVRDRVTQRCNQRLAEMFGYTREEMVGTTTQVFYESAEEWERVGRDASTQIQGGGTYQNEVRGRRLQRRIVLDAGHRQARRSRRRGEGNDLGHRRRGCAPSRGGWPEIRADRRAAPHGHGDRRHRVPQGPQGREMQSAVRRAVCLPGRRAGRPFVGDLVPERRELADVGNEANAVVERAALRVRAGVRAQERRANLVPVAGRILDPHNRSAARSGLHRHHRGQAARRGIRELAHDALTGLPNRRLLDDRIAAFAPGSGERVAIMVLDRSLLPINTYGHEAGDRVLQIVAARLKPCVARPTP